MPRLIKTFVFVLLTAVLGFACSDKRASGHKSDVTGANAPENQRRFKNTKSPQTSSLIPAQGEVVPAIPISKGDILAVQNALRARGYDINNNGIESSETSRAVERFQSDNGLSPTGRIDDAVLSKLNIRPNPDRQPSSIVE